MHFLFVSLYGKALPHHLVYVTPLTVYAARWELPSSMSQLCIRGMEAL